MSFNSNRSNNSGLFNKPNKSRASDFFTDNNSYNNTTCKRGYDYESINEQSSNHNNTSNSEQNSKRTCVKSSEFENAHVQNTISMPSIININSDNFLTENALNLLHVCIDKITYDSVNKIFVLMKLSLSKEIFDEHLTRFKLNINSSNGSFRQTLTKKRLVEQFLNIFNNEVIDELIDIIDSKYNKQSVNDDLTNKINHIIYSIISRKSIVASIFFQYLLKGYYLCDDLLLSFPNTTLITKLTMYDTIQDNCSQIILDELDKIYKYMRNFR